MRRGAFGRATLRLRPQRHGPASIATLRAVLATLLLRTLPYCPYYRRAPPRSGPPHLHNIVVLARWV